MSKEEMDFEDRVSDLAESDSCASVTDRILGDDYSNAAESLRAHALIIDLLHEKIERLESRKS